MNNNRALEFLSEAYTLMQYPHNLNQARCLVRLAVEEVQELLGQVALCDVIDRAPAMRSEARVRPALLVENGRTRMMLEIKNRQLVDGKRQAVDMEVSQ